MSFGPRLDFTAVDLYRSVTCRVDDAGNGGNYVLSPFSILYAGAVLYLGAQGPTRENLNTALHFEPPFGNNSKVLQDIFENTARQLSLKKVLPPSERQRRIPKGLKTELALLNGVFYDPSLQIRTSFANSILKTLHAGVYELPLLAHPEEAVRSMNDWVNTNTVNRVTNLIPLPSGSKRSTGNLALVNTLYFRAAWQMRFPDSSEEEDRAPFYHLNGNVSQPVYLMARRSVAYAEDDDLDVQYVELPYNGDFYMIIVLPKERDGIRDCEDQFSSEALRSLRQKVPLLKAGNRRLVSLQIPKFKVNGAYDMAKLLTDVGVTHALGPNADLSGIVTSGKPKLTSMYHTVSLEINERGTLAASVTETAPVTMGPEMDDWSSDYSPIDFIADHPFLFAILHRPTDALLFIGRIEDPEA
ncbi:leukocyte elastase inhibitor-like [Paramacrobiotus metropolitanus]|uniref:leukocyte elastase inhibitor-like n=1 Tax=Paramacrobiotus metropolitanus TaxID=2943436 RepID=UPI002445C31A|nr:leukocyte elastase inhibitor-like [Paramacrobiotus metropolitanus]